jgi:hypothetical protein
MERSGKVASLSQETSRVTSLAGDADRRLRPCVRPLPAAWLGLEIHAPRLSTFIANWRQSGSTSHQQQSLLWRFFCPWNRISFGLVGRDSPVDKTTQ